jgi:hypothetical protein
MMTLQDFSHLSNARGFILSLRPVCEIVFNIFLLAYVASLEVLAPPGKAADLDEALRLAKEALTNSQTAETLRQSNSIADADRVAEDALQALKNRYGFVGTIYLPNELKY